MLWGRAREGWNALMNPLKCKEPSALQLCELRTKICLGMEERKFPEFTARGHMVTCGLWICAPSPKLFPPPAGAMDRPWGRGPAWGGGPA